MENLVGFIKAAAIVLGNLAQHVLTGIPDIRQGANPAPCPLDTHGVHSPRDTAIILDRSGSMDDHDYEPTRLAGGIEAVKEYINARAQQCLSDKIAVVVFNHEAQVILPLCSIHEKDRIIRALQQLTPDGGTKIGKALKTASKIFNKKLICPHNRQIILLTDGHGDNCTKVADSLKHQYRVVINVIGIGGSRSAVNEPLLRRIATTDPAGCHYRFIKDSQTLKQHYRELATGLVWKGGRNDKS